MSGTADETAPATACAEDLAAVQCADWAAGGTGRSAAIAPIDAVAVHVR